MRKRTVRPDVMTFIPPFLRRGFTPHGEYGTRTNTLAAHRAEARSATALARWDASRTWGYAAPMYRRAASHRRVVADIVRARPPRDTNTLLRNAGPETVYSQGRARRVPRILSSLERPRRRFR